jgi:HD-like signal output (HDOD) protein
VIATPVSPQAKQFQKPVTVDSLQRMKVSVPTCPAVFIRLIQALNNPDSPDLPEIINTDPALAGEVIRAANSAYYGTSKRILSVNDSAKYFRSRRR